ncbi:abnormal spindle-like microcephaly-associated protein homolog [Drosophila eugracilis]|uniref:abnormal spindle-like microcephaly-associated protein homolog n=1 Tax=Drosophila eugracilis TaxID=29029 RepID=UPI0007E78C76|nr:abnormal spindle-like microcephaly-associated protein homolog [Drosophila eugracilis]
MYIYPSSPESASSLQSEESAAIKIQAGFRGYRVRKEIHRSSKSANPRLSNPHTRRNQRQRPKNNALMENQENTGNSRPNIDEQKVTSENGGKSVEDRSATKIQAGFRGFLVRKKQKIATDAAVKIQAGFRGFKTRKELKQCEPIV